MHVFFLSIYALLPLAVSNVWALYTPSALNETVADGSGTRISHRSLLDVFGDPTDILSQRDFESMPYVNGTVDERSLTAREVYSPRITSPGSTTVWVAGTDVTVTWDTSSPPPHAAHNTGRIVLGYLQDGSENEHLDTDHALAQGFDLSKGKVDVKVPYVSPGNEYIIVLFGDSGNRSPPFTIN